MKAGFFLILLLTFAVFVQAGSKKEWKTKSIYQILTDRFAKSGGDKSNCSNLGNYCGGTYRGIIDNLDYIQGMGFDAVWVSPIVKNLEGGYHGYWATDIYSLNENFGTEQDFKDLISALHKRNMWIMVDVVANHVGPVGTDYSRINPFNQEEHYHDYCIIDGDDFAHNQERVENCRLADLPDLKQENDYVKDTLLSWVHDLVGKYNIDGLRIDTIPEVPKWFWTQFQKAAGVYSVGEVFDGRLGYVSDYQNYVDGLLNYPLRYAINDVWKNGNTVFQPKTKISQISSSSNHGFYRLRQQMDDNRKAFKDVDALGVFVDNHDNARFLNGNTNRKGLEASTIFTIFAEGIPIVYYGTEQYYGGGDDPQNREPLWNNLDTSSNLYQMLKIANQVRKDHKTYSQKYIERYVDDDFLSFSRGDVLVALARNDGALSRDVSYLPFSEGDVVCNIFNGNDCLTVNSGSITINLDGYQTKVYVKQDSLPKDTIKEFA